MRFAIAVILLAATPASSATIQEIQTKLSGCQAAKQAAERYLRSIAAAPEKYNNVPETKRVFSAAIAEAESCIAEHQPTVDSHFAAEAAMKAAEAEAMRKGREEAAKRAAADKPGAPTRAVRRLKRARPVQTAPPYTLGSKTMHSAGVAIFITAAVLAGPAAMTALGFTYTAYSAATLWGLAVGAGSAIGTGIYQDYAAYNASERENLRRYDSGNRDTEIVEVMRGR